MKCDNCHERTPSHHLTDANGHRHICCICYVVAGNPPADWHRYCMETARWLAGLREAAGVAP